MVFPLCRFKCRGWNTSAERKRLPQSELFGHEGSLFSSLARFNSQHPASRGPPSAVLPAATPLRCRGRSLHWHLLPESRWEAERNLTCKEKVVKGRHFVPLLLIIAKIKGNMRYSFISKVQFPETMYELYIVSLKPQYHHACSQACFPCDCSLIYTNIVNPHGLN